MKGPWPAESLGGICDILDHKREPVTKRDRVAGQYPYYGATGVLGYVDGYIFDEKLVLVGEDGAKWRAGENTSFQVEGKYWVNNHAHVLRPHRSRLLDSWLVYYLNHSDLSEFVSGLTVPKLNQGNLREIPIPMPPLPEQQRIVRILDEAFEGIATARANAEKNLKNARALSESHLQAVFSQRGEGWSPMKLGALCDQITDGTHNSPAYAEAGIPMLDSKHVKDGFFIDDTDPDKFISKETDALLAKRCKPRVGDILISSRGTIGKLAIVREGQNFNIMGNMILIRLPVDVSREFAAFYLSSQVKNIELMAHGVAQKGLYLSQIRDYELPLPIGSQQAQIGEQLSALAKETECLESIYQRKLEALDALKQSLLHQAFSGAL